MDLFDPCSHELKDIGGGIMSCTVPGCSFSYVSSKATFFELDGERYIRAVPAKTLFHSTMIHEVVNRGDVFAVNLRTGVLTVISGKEQPKFAQCQIAF